jgi:hypothetical protein
MTVTVEADERLEQRSSNRGGKSDHTDLAIVQAKGVSKQRIKSREKGLHRVVEQMADTDGEQDFEGGALRRIEVLGGKCRDVGLG